VGQLSNMPTGAKATKELFEKLIAFGKKHSILIVNDNPYSFILTEKTHEYLTNGRSQRYSCRTQFVE
jgi:aspartate/methionine/tyrosine aminotransferase